MFIGQSFHYMFQLSEVMNVNHAQLIDVIVSANKVSMNIMPIRKLDQYIMERHHYDQVKFTLVV